MHRETKRTYVLQYTTANGRVVRKYFASLEMAEDAATAIRFEQDVEPEIYVKRN